MTEMLEVTIAPGTTITIDPHPSGVPGLPALVLHGGDRIRVPLDEAERLYHARKVVGLKSGRVKPPDAVRDDLAPSVIIGNGPALQGVEAAMAQSANMQMAMENYAARENARIEREWTQRERGDGTFRQAPVTIQTAADSVGAFTDRFPWE